MNQTGADDLYGAVPELPLFAEPDLFAGSAIEPSAMERVVAGILAQHRGWQQAIPLKALMDATGRDERQVRGVVEQLIVAHRMRIGTSLAAPCGYYTIETAEDLTRAVGPYKSQILSMLKRLRVLMEPHELRELYGQMGLDEGK